jgi:hypothetical protein
MPNSVIDVQNGAPNPESYTDNFDGTVTDNVTGLIWQQTAPTVQYNASNAAAYCASLSLGGKNDWRLPTIIELVTLADFTGFKPAWDSGAFGNTQLSLVFVSSTPAVGTANQWCVHFGDGGPQTYAATLGENVRCVR